jgi:predicted O-methyltransferase YrrM
MNKELWSEVDRYIEGTVVPPDAGLDGAIAASAAAGLPAIAVSPAQGKFLHLLCRSIGAKRVLEIGTLGGYSAIWMARALPAGGRLVTLEVDEKHAKVAKEAFVANGLAGNIQIRLGKALDTLPLIAQEDAGLFDFVFIDADKQNIAEYFDWSVKLTRPGALIVVDNVVRDGKVLDAATDDAMVQGVRRFNEALKRDKRVDATTLQLVGVKGYDGMTLALRV